MYLGTSTLTALEIFIWGYNSCLEFKGLVEKEESSLSGFYEFVKSTYDTSPNSMGWRMLILNHCRGDEELALKEFFTLYDRFVRLTENNGGEQVSDE